MFTTIPIATNFDEHNKAEFIADEVELPGPILIARVGRYEILEDIGAYWLYRREPEHCPPRAYLLGDIPDQQSLQALFDCLGRALQEIDSLTISKPVVV